MRSGGPPTALDPTATPGRPLRHRGARSRSAHTVAQALLLPDFEKQPPPPGKEATFTVRFHFGRYCETVAPSGRTRPHAGVGGATVRVDAAQRAACAPPPLAPIAPVGHLFAPMREIAAGLLGLGNVGSGVVKLIQDNVAAIEARLGARVVVRKIAVQKAEKRRLVQVDKKLLTTDARAVIDDPGVEVIVELIGGDEPARQYVLQAIASRRHVVTANKLLLAAHGDELISVGEHRGVDI